MDYFIDTNIFLRALVKENEKTFKECYQFLKLVEERRLRALTSSLVLAEIEWVLGSFYKFEKTKVVQALGSVLSLKGLQIIDAINPRLALEIFREKNVKFIDALIASDPRIFKKEVIVVSYDRDFDKIGVLRKEPKEF